MGKVLDLKFYKLLWKLNKPKMAYSRNHPKMARLQCGNMVLYGSETELEIYSQLAGDGQKYSWR